MTLSSLGGILTSLKKTQTDMHTLNTHTCTLSPYTHTEDSLSESEDEGGAASSSKKDKPLAALQKKLRELNTAYELVEKNNHLLVQQIAETEVERREVSAKLKERLALFKLTADAMVKVMMRRERGVRR